MRVPLSWLAALMPELPSAAEVARLLTVAGLESELENPIAVPEGVVTGMILSCEQHPNADRLSVCRVDVGDGEPRVIVCGAPNASAGWVGAVALPGAELAKGFVIEERSLRGVHSAGMLCSEAELGISEAADGILLLAPQTPRGVPLAEALALEPVLVTDPTANRGDCFSIEGVARELGAILERKFEPRVPRVPQPRRSAGWTVRIEDPVDCPRYAGRIVEGLTPGPSPDWLARRLAAAGVRPIDRLVDATNYVLLELGHPLHAFDLDRLQGSEILVRRARAAEKLTTLDGKPRELTTDILTIADESGPVALAGVMGGESTMVTPETRRVLLEGASFAPALVRGAARSLRLVSDASNRFERGVDPASVPRALDRCVELLREMCPEAELSESFESYPAPVEAREIALRRRTLRRLLGIEPDRAEVGRIFRNLHLDVVSETDEGWTVMAPTFRRDLLAEEDLVEEVARIHGYDQIPERAQVHASAPRVAAPRADSLARSRRVLLGAGLTEVVTPSLVDPTKEDSLVARDAFFSATVPVRNPLSLDRGGLRGCLVPSLVQVLAANRARSLSDLGVFEVGRAFAAREDGSIRETQRVAVLLAGEGLSTGVLGGGKPCDFFDMKGILEVYVEELVGKRFRVEGSAPAPLSSSASARVVVDGEVVGFLGELHSEVRRAHDFPVSLPVIAAELDLDVLAAFDPGMRLYQALPRFPAVVRDLAFVVPESCSHEELVAALRREGGELLDKIRLFDVYEGAPLAESERGLAFTLAFRSPERSLTHEEIDALVKKMIAKLERELGTRIR
jgi:phenylalanyl-tRNA synthetase beta chain